MKLVCGNSTRRTVGFYLSSDAMDVSGVLVCGNSTRRTVGFYCMLIDTMDDVKRCDGCW